MATVPNSLLTALLAALTVGPAVAQETAPPKVVLPTDRSVLPIPEPKIDLITELDARKAKAPPRFEVARQMGSIGYHDVHRELQRQIA